MIENAVKARWRKGRVAVGCWLALPSAVSAEILARQGFDYVCIDMQHGMIDFQTALTMLQAISASPAVPFARVPSNDFAAINKILDAGALGVIVPMVNSAEEARAAVNACRYHPEGSRSFGPTRARYSAGADYFERANAEIACIPMIETRQAVERIDQILSVPGIDAVYVGPADLSITLDQKPAMDNQGPFEAARQAIAKACAAHGVTAGIHASAELAERHIAAGYRLITVSSDIGSLALGGARDLRTVRALREAGD